jgi:ribonuclease R
MQPLPAVADHISETERNSDDAERASRDVKLFAFLIAQTKSAQPPRYRAMVTDVRNFGFFVDVTELGMSGLVPLSGLTDDFYIFDESRSQLVGRRTRRTFKLGDRLEVQIAKVDTFKRQVDFKLPGGPAGRSAPASKQERSPGKRREERLAPGFKGGGKRKWRENTGNSGSSRKGNTPPSWPRKEKGKRTSRRVRR